jgi:hypothetical protein
MTEITKEQGELAIQVAGIGKQLQCLLEALETYLPLDSQMACTIYSYRNRWTDSGLEEKIRQIKQVYETQQEIRRKDDRTLDAQDGAQL